MRSAGFDEPPLITNKKKRSKVCIVPHSDALKTVIFMWLAVFIHCIGLFPLYKHYEWYNNDT